MIGTFVLNHSLGPDSHGSSQSILDGILFVTLAKTVFRVMQHILFLRHSFLPENHAITLCTALLGIIFPLLFETDTSPRLLLTRNPNGLVSVR